MQLLACMVEALHVPAPLGEEALSLEHWLGSEFHSQFSFPSSEFCSYPRLPDFEVSARRTAGVGVAGRVRAILTRCTRKS